MYCSSIVFLLFLLTLGDVLAFPLSRPQTLARRRHAQTQYCAAIEAIDLRQWGVFDHAQVNLTGRPLFAVITGETGAGKSVLVNALEYLCFGSTKRSLFRPGSETSVSLHKGGHDLKRSFNAETRRSYCEIDGQKTTVRGLSEYVAGWVRFWSADENNLKNNAGAGSDGGSNGNGGGGGGDRIDAPSLGFFAYLDSYIGQDGPAMLEQMRAAYSEWLMSHQDLKRLLSLERRVIQGNEAELLTYFASEVDTLESKLHKLMAELLCAVQDLDISDDMSPFDDEEEIIDAAPPTAFTFQETKAKTTTSVPLSAMADLLQALKDVNPSKFSMRVAPFNNDGDYDLRKCWKALLLADRVFNSLSRAIVSAFPLAGSSFMGGSTGLGAKKASSDARQLDSLEKSVDEYGGCLLSLQVAFNGLGLSGSTIDGKIEKAQLALQAASELLRNAHGELESVQENLPDVSGVLAKLALVRAEWEALARKHGGIPPPELQRLRKEWNGDISSLATMRSDLPYARLAEGAAKERYRTVAEALSAKRHDAAALLSSKVNAVLPSLEMADKFLMIDLRSHSDDLLEPTSPKVTAIGWDEVHLSIASTLISGGESAVAGGHERSTTAAISTLSSGETARLSLALETCCLDNGGDQQTQEVGGPQPHGLVVYDEIDAHIGGEAAVAVARLLRSQGRKWQVVAITHNPVIAAAADMHLVVRRNRDTGQDRARSTVAEVTGVQRETELARMATGRLDTTAGMNLARALLGAFAE